MSLAKEPSGGFAGLSADILQFFERAVWPLRLDRVATMSEERAQFDATVGALLLLLEANPPVLAEWLSLPAPARAEGEGESGAFSALERIRLYGPLRCRAYLAGAYLRHQPGMGIKEQKGKLDWVDDPMPSWKPLGKVLDGSERTFELRLECSVMLEAFQGWLRQASDPAQAARARKWLEQRAALWARLSGGLASASKDGSGVPVSSVFRSQVLLDLGRAALIARFEQAEAALADADKRKLPLPVALFGEVDRHGFCSAQVGAVWAQALGRWSSLSTPLRLLMRPWRMSHPQAIEAHRATVRALLSWCEGGALP